MSEHTPTPATEPQRTRGALAYDPELNRVYSLTTNECVAAPHVPGNPSCDAAWTADAEFIVRSWNCHDELVDIAERYERYVASQNAFSGDNDGARFIRRELKEIRALIAKARGETK